MRCRDFHFQVAGYQNSVIPTQCYRSTCLASWSGNFVNYAVALRDMWDRVEGLKPAEDTLGDSVAEAVLDLD